MTRARRNIDGPLLRVLNTLKRLLDQEAPVEQVRLKVAAAKQMLRLPGDLENILGAAYWAKLQAVLHPTKEASVTPPAKKVA